MAGPWFALDNCLTCSRLSQSRYWLRLKLQEREENSGDPAINTTGGRYCTVLLPFAQYKDAAVMVPEGGPDALGNRPSREADST